MAEQITRRQALSLIGAGMLAAACQTPEPAWTKDDVYKIGNFSKKYAQAGKEGIVVGVPFGTRDPGAEDIGRYVAEQNGFGLVSAHIPEPFRVYYPAEGTSGSIRANDFTQRARAVYDEFLGNLKQASRANSIDHYFNISIAEGRKNYSYVDAITLGYSPNEREQIRAVYNRLLNALPADVEKRALLFLKGDRIKYLYPDIQNEGVLLHGNRGMSIVTSKMDEMTKEAYVKLFSEWTKEVASAFRPNPNVEILSLPEGIQGRFTKIPGKSLEAIVTAPHGGDTFSDHIAEEIARSLDLNALLVHGFNTTSWGKWQRVNINRPTEGMTNYVNEAHTSIARNIYNLYRGRVLNLAGGTSPLLVEIHTNVHSGLGNRIEVATQGISRETAEALLKAYESALDEEKQKAPITEAVLGLEPLSHITMVAYGAKQVGIMGEFPKALHIEIPMTPLLYSRDDNGVGNMNLEAYTRIMARVVKAAIFSLKIS